MKKRRSPTSPAKGRLTETRALMRPSRPEKLKVLRLMSAKLMMPSVGLPELSTREMPTDAPAVPG